MNKELEVRLRTALEGFYARSNDDDAKRVSEMSLDIIPLAFKSIEGPEPDNDYGEHELIEQYDAVKQNLEILLDDKVALRTFVPIEKMVESLEHSTEGRRVDQAVYCLINCALIENNYPELYECGEAPLVQVTTDVGNGVYVDVGVFYSTNTYTYYYCVNGEAFDNDIIWSTSQEWNLVAFLDELKERTPDDYLSEALELFHNNYEFEGEE